MQPGQLKRTLERSGGGALLTVAQLDGCQITIADDSNRMHTTRKGRPPSLARENSSWRITEG